MMQSEVTVKCHSGLDAVFRRGSNEILFLSTEKLYSHTH